MQRSILSLFLLFSIAYTSSAQSIFDIGYFNQENSNITQMVFNVNIKKH